MTAMSRKDFLRGAGLGIASSMLAGSGVMATANAASEKKAPGGEKPVDYVAPRMGAFAEPPIAGFFEFNASDHLPTTSYFGLPQGETWPYAYLRSSADGAEVDLLTWFTAGVAAGMLLRIEDFKDPKAYERLDPRGEKFLRGGSRVKYADVNGDLVLTGGHFASPNPTMTFKAGKKDFSWVEEGVLDLKGTILGPGMHHYMPWRDGKGKLGGTYYVSVLYRVSGTMFGEQYQGWAGFDQSYQPQGVPWGEGMEAGRDQALWGIWAQELEDGTIQYGQFSRGLGTFNFAFVSDGGRQYSSNVVKADVTLRKDGSGYVDRATYHLANGEQWQFVNRVGQAARGDFRSQSGQMRKVGDERKVKSWYCIFESFPSRLEKLGYT